MRLRLDRGRQHPHRGAAMGQDARDRRARRGSLGEVSALELVQRAPSPLWGEGGGSGPLPIATPAVPPSPRALTRADLSPVGRGGASDDAANCRMREFKDMQRTKPPFRADHVGSLLRTAPLKEARARRERGE